MRPSCCLAVVLLPGIVTAGQLDLRATVATDELFRGIPQNNSLSVALRGDYRFDSRVYLGGRVLNNRSQGDVEADAYLGYSWPLVLLDLIPATADVGMSASAFAGRNPGGLDDPDYLEGYASLGVGPLRFGGNYAPDYWGTGAAAYRLTSQLKWPLLPGLSATGLVGWNAGEGVRRLVVSRRPGGRGIQYADYGLVISQELPLSFTAFGQVAGTTVDIDGSRAPTFLLGLRWRYGV